MATSRRLASLLTQASLVALLLAAAAAGASLLLPRSGLASGPDRCRPRRPGGGVVLLQRQQLRLGLLRLARLQAALRPGCAARGGAFPPRVGRL